MAVLAYLDSSFRLAYAVPVLLVTFFLFRRGIEQLQHQRFKRENGCKSVKGVYGWDPFFGLDRLWRSMRAFESGNSLDRSVKGFEQAGSTFRVVILSRKIVLTSEPENIKTILSLRFNDFSLGNRKDTLGLLLGNGIFNSDGEQWRHSRAMIRPNFAREHIADLESFEKYLAIFFKCIPTDGTTVDLQELFFRYTMDTSTEFLLGRSVDALQEKLSGGSLNDSFADQFTKAQIACTVLTRSRILKMFSKNRDCGKENIEYVHRFVDMWVEDALAYRAGLKKEGASEEKEKYVFLRQLAKDTGDRKRLRDEVLSILLAGRDTTASLLSSMWFELVRNERVMTKLRQEVDELGGEPPSYSQLRNMKYMRYVINEVLRLWPVVPANSRLAVKDTVLPTGGGPDGKSPAFIPKGTVVVYHVYAMQHRKDLWGPDASEFKPERWHTARPGWEYLPFNGGPRICLGQQYALTEAMYVTARILQQYSHLESRDNEPWAEALALTLCSRNGVKVAVTPA